MFKGQIYVHITKALHLAICVCNPSEHHFSTARRTEDTFLVHPLSVVLQSTQCL